MAEKRRAVLISAPLAVAHREKHLARLRTGVHFTAQLTHDIKRRIMQSRYFLVLGVTPLGYEVAECTLEGHVLQEFFLGRLAIAQLNVLPSIKRAP